MQPVQVAPISPQPVFNIIACRGCGRNCARGTFREQQSVGVATAEVLNNEAEAPIESEEKHDAEPLRTMKSPIMPSKADIEDHKIDHFPYREWCDECVEGMGRERVHLHTRSHDREAVVSIDYMFVTNDGIFSEEDQMSTEQQEQALKVLVLKDSKSRAVFAHAVPQKGIDPKRYIIDTIVQDILYLGYSQIILKSDNEPAIVHVLKETLASLKASGVSQAGEEHSPPYDSQANGDVESAVKQVRQRLRTMHMCLERRLHKRIPPQHPLICWLVSHVAALVRYRVRGTDGRTPHERLRLRPFNLKLLCFGEQCKYKNRAKEPLGSDPHRWHKGTFLGVCPMTSQYILCNQDTGAIAYARTILRTPDELKWDAKILEGITTTPYIQHVPRAQEVTFQEHLGEQPTDDVKKIQIAKKLYVRPADLKAFGYTKGCPKCDNELRYGPGRTTKSHSDSCRDRIIARLLETPEGVHRVRSVTERLDRTLAEYVEHAQQPRPSHGGDDQNVVPVVDRVPRTAFQDFDAPHVDPRVAAPADDIPAPVIVPANQPDDDDDEKPDLIASSDDDNGKDDGDERASPEMEIDFFGDALFSTAKVADQASCHNVGTAKAADQVEDDAQGETDLRDFFKMMEHKHRDEMEKVDGEIMQVLDHLGVGENKKRAFRREQHKAVKRMVSEIYSPARVSALAKMCPEYDILPGFALDLTVSDIDGRVWDFDDDEMQRRAWAKIHAEAPLMIIGTPMCTAFSAWQHLNALKRDPEIVHVEYIRALKHLSFCCDIYDYQVRHGRFFLHEHPATASSWGTTEIQKIMSLEGVRRVVAHQCQYGQQAHEGSPIKKPTGFMTNCEGVARRLNKLCKGKHGFCSRAKGGQHILCNGRVARQAAVFPMKLCHAILAGLRDQLKAEGTLLNGIVGIQERVDCGTTDEEREDDGSDAQVYIVDGMAFKIDNGEGPFFDDLTSQPLPTQLVKAARRKELDYFEGKQVWKRMTISEAWRITGRAPISVRWVDVNKADDQEPEIRSRLVARQMRGPGEEPLFAPTPPLEALRTVLSWAATDIVGEAPKCRDPESPDRVQISLIDVSRAYFNAECDPDKPTFVALPHEDPDHEAMCGLLLKHMYGTQAAADGWQQEYSSTLVEMGFTQGVASPCVFSCPARGLISSVHGDDFTTAGSKPQLDWFERELEGRYELRKGGRIGPGREDAKEGRVLNRVIRWTSEGIEYEADPRQAEKLIEAIGLEGANSCVTPGLKALPEQIEQEQPLEKAEHTLFRRHAACSNYLSADRLDVQYAAKEICRWMSAPTDLSIVALRRLVRYLVGRKRLIYKYPWQSADTLECYSDTDWAGCPRTRKSTSGGVLMFGSHVIKSWSSTQPSISLSSGEAEYYGVVKASGIAIGQQSLMRDLGMAKVKVRVWTDSSAAMGISKRSGLGKLRHVQTHTLWVQERVRTGAIELRKVPGEANPADLFTKHLSSRDRIEQLVKLMNCEFRDGRAESAPQIRRIKNNGDSKQAALSTEGLKSKLDHSISKQQQQQQQHQSVLTTTPTTDHDDDDAHDSDESIPEAMDTGLLPHQHPREVLDAIFAKCTAEEDLECYDGRCECWQPDCVKCFRAST